MSIVQYSHWIDDGFLSSYQRFKGSLKGWWKKNRCCWTGSIKTVTSKCMKFIDAGVEKRNHLRFWYCIWFWKWRDPYVYKMTGFKAPHNGSMFSREFSHQNNKNLFSYYEVVAFQKDIYLKIVLCSFSLYIGLSCHRIYQWNAI